MKEYFLFGQCITNFFDWLNDSGFIVNMHYCHKQGIFFDVS